MALSLGPPFAPWPVPAFGGAPVSLAGGRREAGCWSLGVGAGLSGRDAGLPGHGAGHFGRTACLALPRSQPVGDHGLSVAAGNCAVKRSLVCQRAAMIQASGGREPSGGHSLRPGNPGGPRRAGALAPVLR